MSKLLTVPQVAEILKTSTRTVQRRIAEGAFPNAFRLGPDKTSPYRIPAEDLKAFTKRYTPPDKD